MSKPYRFKELFRKLKKHDPRFEVKVNKGKGSHRELYHPDIDGEERGWPLAFHVENPEFDRAAIAAIKRRFKLPKHLL
jgi:hypothetical protein